MDLWKSGKRLRSENLSKRSLDVSVMLTEEESGFNLAPHYSHMLRPYSDSPPFRKKNFLCQSKLVTVMAAETLMLQREIRAKP